MTKLTHRIVVSIDNIDNDAHESPEEWEDGVEIFSFSSRHHNFKHPDVFGLHGRPPDVTSSLVGIRRKLKAGTAFVLSCYQHSGIAWSLMGEGMQDRFDTVLVAGVLFQEGRRGETYAQRAERARAFLAAYSAWCNGEVYVAELRGVDDDDDDAVLDIYGGLCGQDRARAGVRDLCAAHEIPTEACAVFWL